LYRPLDLEQYAFREVAKAIDVLDVSNEEAYNYIEKACDTLKERTLRRVGWYKEANETVSRFLENLQLIVLPAIHDSKMAKEHLQAIALTIASMNIAETKTMNEMLESNYEKAKPKAKAIHTLLTTIRTTIMWKILVSLASGYVLILAICFLYAIGTSQNFMTFLKDQPAIVILGGLGVSGITFWRTK
jgi:hypothetical protein